MLLFAHTGITLGSAFLLARASGKSRSNSNTSWLTTIAEKIDYRMVLIGSMLPDIIDKPVGMVFFRDFFSNGRIFSHTLVFLIIFVIPALLLFYQRKASWLLALSFGIFIHFVLDQMWLTPGPLLWPLYGWSFDRLNLSHWTQGIFYDLLNDPATYIPELLGAVILALFALHTLRTKKSRKFVQRGAL